MGAASVLDPAALGGQGGAFGLGDLLKGMARN